VPAATILNGDQYNRSPHHWIDQRPTYQVDNYSLFRNQQKIITEDIEDENQHCIVNEPGIKFFKRVYAAAATIVPKPKGNATAKQKRPSFG
jgi:hypothetical protein